MRSRDVYLLTTCDEECGGSLGMQTVLDTIWQLCGRSFTGGEIFSGADVISEGGGFPIMLCGKPVYLCEVGQKGAATVHFTVKARHSKGPFLGSMDGVQRAMALVNELSQLRLPDVSPGVAEQQDATAQPCAFDRFLASLCEAGNVTPDALMSQLSPLMRKMLQAMQSSTLTVTMVEGVSPVETVITCDVRLLPGMQKDVLERIFTDRANAFDADWAWMSYSEGYEGQGSELLDIMEKETGERVVPFLSMGASDGRYLAPLGARVYGYSPVLPSDVTFDQAVSMVHGVDERIHVDSVTFGAQVLTCVVACATNEARQESEEQA